MKMYPPTIFMLSTSLSMHMNFSDVHAINSGCFLLDRFHRTLMIWNYKAVCKIKSTGTVTDRRLWVNH